MSMYCYAEEMYKICFKISQVLIVLEEKSLSEFYSAAADGFYNRQHNMTLKQADEQTTPEHLNDLANLISFYTDKEKLACKKLEMEAV